MTVIDLISVMKEEERVTVYGVYNEVDGLATCSIWINRRAKELMEMYEQSNPEFIEKCFAQEIAQATIYRYNVPLVIWTNINIDDIPHNYR